MLPYLLASLPSPRLGETPETDPDAFLDTCGRFLGDDRAQELAAALGRDAAPSRAGGASAAARAWSELAAHVNDEIVRHRCARVGRDAAPHLQRPAGVRVDVRTGVREAFEAPNPAARERALDALRWRLADELAATEPLGAAALVARAVQLGIAWRWAGWDADAGWATLEAHLRRIEQDATGEASEAAGG
ncbi:MAG: hypothetical protein GVY27_01190 [Deinococcus-Thermus bacterium]|jgi:hypothetical protein|nr:hypothetical protein [Deinococcota bacterium]